MRPPFEHDESFDAAPAASSPSVAKLVAVFNAANRTPPPSESKVKRGSPASTAAPATVPHLVRRSTVSRAHSSTPQAAPVRAPWVPFSSPLAPPRLCSGAANAPSRCAPPAGKHARSRSNGEGATSASVTPRPSGKHGHTRSNGELSRLSQVVAAADLPAAGGTRAAHSVALLPAVPKPVVVAAVPCAHAAAEAQAVGAVKACVVVVEQGVDAAEALASAPPPMSPQPATVTPCMPCMLAEEGGHAASTVGVGGQAQPPACLEAAIAPPAAAPVLGSGMVGMDRSRACGTGVPADVPAAAVCLPTSSAGEELDSVLLRHSASSSLSDGGSSDSSLMDYVTLPAAEGMALDARLSASSRISPWVTIELSAAAAAASTPSTPQPSFTHRASLHRPAPITTQAIANVPPGSTASGTSASRTAIPSAVFPPLFDEDFETFAEVVAVRRREPAAALPPPPRQAPQGIPLCARSDFDVSCIGDKARPPAGLLKEGAVPPVSRLVAALRAPFR